MNPYDNMPYEVIQIPKSPSTQMKRYEVPSALYLSRLLGPHTITFGYVLGPFGKEKRTFTRDPNNSRSKVGFPEKKRINTRILHTTISGIPLVVDLRTRM